MSCSRSRALFLACVCSLLCGCLQPGTAVPLAELEQEGAVAVRRGSDGERIGFEAMLDDVAAADAVFVGEIHIDETTHRVELAVLEGIAERRRNKVVLALEMFERDVQGVLNDYLSGRIDEAAFLDASRPWGQYATAYRPLIELARERGLPVVASNFPRPMRRELGMGGNLEAYASLRAKHGELVPAELLPNSDLYWKRMDNAIRGHLGMMGAQTPDSRRVSTQSLWDNSMGEACAQALEDHPGYAVVHVNGGFHSAYGEGTAAQLLARRPGADIRTLDVVPSLRPQAERPAGLPRGDYVIYASNWAEDRNEGTWAVTVGRRLRYRLHVPETARTAGPVPWLLWFSDDGWTSEDGLALWKERLGGEVVLAVIEPLYRERGGDLSEGGRWFWPDSFTSDLASLQQSVRHMATYLERYFPVDPERLVIAGEGTGATVAVTAALFSDRDLRAVALAPRGYAKIKDYPLPLPELRGTDPAPTKSVRVTVGGDAADWWDAELDGYAQVGFPGTRVEPTEDPWEVELQAENELRRALGLELRAYDDAAPRHHVVLPARATRARVWARHLALSAVEEGPVAVLSEAPSEGDSTLLDAGISSRDLGAEGFLPRCPGPFGGTTVVVLPPDVGPAERERWQAVAADDPLQAQSRFHRLRVVGPSGLPDLLVELRDQGRTNVLIVPGRFYAGAAFMADLQGRVRGLGDRMTLHWSPGLGDRM